MLLAQCQNTQKPQTPPNPMDATLTDAFPGLRFNYAIELTTAPDAANRFFVALQTGQIEVFENQANTASKSTFLDIQTRLLSGGERGLLGLAFHPDYANNGYFYVNYTRNNSGLETVIARFKVKTGKPNEADPNSELILLTFDQPYANHNGGAIKFGKDGLLYIATGDGGSGGDPQNYAQNRTNLLGKILRIDVNKTENGLNYAIPTDNPYRNNTQGFRAEIYAYGLRNPWKISFDRQTGALWTADVGQNAYEEIDIIEKGKNYGWRFREANHCYNPTENCPSNDLTDPVFEYSQENGDRSITGGYVYRGKKHPAWQGKYLYGDYASGRIWLLTYTNNQTQNQLLWDTTQQISSFGEDKEGELYVVNYGSNAAIMKVE